MPRRPRSHQLEDISRNRLHRIFEEAGWTVEDLVKDYGEDLLVRIFNNGEATSLSFFVQAKATDNIAEYLDRDAQTIKYPIAVEHLNHWETFHEPVILTVCDSKSDCTYWTCIQNVLARLQSAQDLTRRKTFRIPVRTEDMLNANGLGRIHEITQQRHGRSKREADVAKILTDFLRTKLGSEIDYSSHGVMTIVQPKQGAEVIFFGKMLEQLQEFCNLGDLSPQEAFDRAMELFVKEIRAYERTGKFPVRNKETGKIELRQLTRDQLNAHILETLEP